MLLCVPRACPGSPLAVLQLPAGTRPAVRELQSLTDGPIRPAAAALRLRTGKTVPDRVCPNTPKPLAVMRNDNELTGFQPLPEC